MSLLADETSLVERRQHFASPAGSVKTGWRGQGGISLIELAIVIIVIGVLGVFAVTQFSDTPYARAVAMYTVAQRLATDWKTASDACGINSSVNNALASTTGASATDLLWNTLRITPTFRKCFAAAYIRPLSDVIQLDSFHRYLLMGYPLDFTGGGPVPFVVTYHHVRENIVVALTTKFGLHPQQPPLPAIYMDPDDQIHFRHIAADDYDAIIVIGNRKLLFAQGGNLPTIPSSGPPSPGPVTPPSQGQQPPTQTTTSQPPGAPPANPPSTKPPCVSKGPGTPPSTPPSGGGNPCASLATNPKVLLTEAGSSVGGVLTLPSGCKVSVVNGNGNKVANNGTPILVIGNGNQILGNGGTVYVIGNGNKSSGSDNLVTLSGNGNFATGRAGSTMANTGGPFYVTGNGNKVDTVNGGPVVSTGNGNKISDNTGSIVNAGGNGNKFFGNGGSVISNGNGNKILGNTGTVDNTAGNGNQIGRNGGTIVNAGGNGNKVNGNSGNVTFTGNGNHLSGNTGTLQTTGNGLHVAP